MKMSMQRGGVSCVFRRYLPLVCIALAILLFQGFLAYSLYAVAGGNELLKPPKLKIIKSGLQSAPDDYYGDDEAKNAKRSAAQPLYKAQPNPSKLSGLPFSVNCEINETEAISAINRATSLDCKRRLVETVCAHKSGQLYPTKLKSTCPIKDGSLGDNLGCFSFTDIETLPKPYFVSNTTKKRTPDVKYITSEECTSACLLVGKALAVHTPAVKRCLCGSNMGELNGEIGANRMPQGSTCRSCHNCANVYKTGLLQNPSKHDAVMPQGGKSPRARIVFLLTLNGRALRQVNRLIKAINNTSKLQHYFYIHVDSRQDYLYRSLSKMEDRPNIKLTRTRFSTIWGGATLLQMLLSCFKELLQIAHWKWDYVINLSETDFPIKRIDLLEQFLGENKGYNFVRSHGQDTPKFISKQALSKTFYECDNHMWRLGERSLPGGIRIDGGSDWVGLHRDFCEYITENRQTDDLLVGLEKVYRLTLLPAESYFHTILQNTHFCTMMVDNNLRFVNWKRKQGCKCQYKHIVDWCGCSPNVIMEGDLAKVDALNKKPIFFGRKFESAISQTVIDSIETKLGLVKDPTSNPWSFTSFWQNEYHHSDISPRSDDSKLTVYSSLSRISCRHLANVQTSHCVTYARKVLQSFLYFEEDKFKGIVIQYEAHAQHIDEPIVAEVLLRPVRSFSKSGKFQNDPFDERLRRLEVSSEYDVKEQMFRNYAAIIGPYSDPGVLHEWDSGPAGSVTFVWVDPAKVAAGSYEIKIGPNSQVQHHKPPLNKPLRPGLWTLKVFKEWILMAETSFMG